MDATQRQTWQDALLYLRDDLGADRALVLKNRPDGDPEVLAAHGIEADSVWTVGDISQEVLRQGAAGQATMVSDAVSDSKLGERSSVVISGLRSILCVPVKRGEEVLGALYADSQLRTGIFGRKHRKQLEAFADELAGRLG